MLAITYAVWFSLRLVLATIGRFLLCPVCPRCLSCPGVQPDEDCAFHIQSEVDLAPLFLSASNLAKEFHETYLKIRSEEIRQLRAKLSGGHSDGPSET